MLKVKNDSPNLFRWQEFIWRPGEVLVFNENGLVMWEERLVRDLTASHKNLVIVNDETTKEDDAYTKMYERMKKAREARKANRDSNTTT